MFSYESCKVIINKRLLPATRMEMNHSWHEKGGQSYMVLVCFKITEFNV